MPGCAVYTDSAQNDQKIDDRDTIAADIPGVQVKDDLSAANDGSNDEQSHMGDWASLSSELQHVDI